MNEILKRTALSIGRGLLVVANVEGEAERHDTLPEADETEHLPVPPQDPLTPTALAMMYTPPVRATKAEPVALAGSAQERAEKARRNQR